MTTRTSPSMDEIISLAKRRGFIFPGSEIYGGLAGTWDWGPRGVALKRNIQKIWWEMFVTGRDDMYGLDASILMNKKVLEASGHASGFTDPLAECPECHTLIRADALLAGADSEPCPECGAPISQNVSRAFNMMFETKVGASGKSADIAYLRPETAQGIFVNFKNVLDSMHPALPFGIGQIGKAFRNEIAPRDFVFRAREFEQMEVEYFVRPDDWQRAFDEWRGVMLGFIDEIGIDTARVHELEVPTDELAHYSKRTIDFEFDYPFGRKELYGIAYRTDFDLRSHTAGSGADLVYTDTATGEKIVPHVIEPSLGVDRSVLAVLLSCYKEDEMNGEKRTYLAFPPAVAPSRAAVFPLLKNKPALVAKARDVFTGLRKTIPSVAWDDNGNIGKRYRRQDEIGTPHCITIDFQTLEDDTVTVRDRDSGSQERVAVADLRAKLL